MLMRPYLVIHVDSFKIGRVYSLMWPYLVLHVDSFNIGRVYSLMWPKLSFTCR